MSEQPKYKLGIIDLEIADDKALAEFILLMAKYRYYDIRIEPTRVNLKK